MGSLRGTLHETRDSKRGHKQNTAALVNGAFERTLSACVEPAYQCSSDNHSKRKLRRQFPFRQRLGGWRLQWFWHPRLLG